MGKRPVQLTDVQDHYKLFEYLRELEAERDKMQRTIESLSRRGATVELTSDVLTQIKESLESLGSHELDLSSMTGILADPQNTTVPRVFQLPDVNSTLYTMVVRVGTGGNPDELHVLDTTVNPRVWRQVATTPTNYVTTNTAQTGIANTKEWANKQTYKDNLILETLVEKYLNVATVSAGVPSIVALYVNNGQAGALALTTLYANPAGATRYYRVSVVITTTNTGNPGDNVTANVAWNDGANRGILGIALQNGVSGLDLTSATATASGVCILEAAAGTNITIATTGVFAGVPTYDILAVVERL